MMSGESRGMHASAIRLATGAAEPFYAIALRLRNLLYQKGLKKTHCLSRPVISVGNITTGGTGKTPVVEFLARRLREAGRNVCILSRGYKSAGQLGDEQRMLDESLNTSGPNRVKLIANPNRVVGAHDALADDPTIDVFLLDDGFQHRAVRRDFDIVLVNAREPFGYGHVLPRGMLREPLTGLRRADAFIVTHADQVSPAELSQIEMTLRAHQSDAPIYRCAHVHAGLSSDSTSQVANPNMPIDELSKRRFFLFCGIGDPQSLHTQLSKYGINYIGHHFFPDHHRFEGADMDRVQAEAAAAGAEALVTTAKDWVKLSLLTRQAAMPILRLDLAVQFLGDGEKQFIDQIENEIHRADDGQR